jgi:hypothetical protein
VTAPRIARDRSINRSDPAYMAQWRAYYRDIFKRYAEDVISRPDAQYGLISLGYRDQALEIELAELERAKEVHQRNLGAG